MNFNPLQQHHFLLRLALGHTVEWFNRDIRPDHQNTLKFVQKNLTWLEEGERSVLLKCVCLTTVAMPRWDKGQPKLEKMMEKWLNMCVLR